MKCRALWISVAVAVALAGCGNADKGTDDTTSAASLADEAALPTEAGGVFINPYTDTADFLENDANYYYFQRREDFSTLYPGAEVKKTTISHVFPNGEAFVPILLDDTCNMYGYCDSGETQGEIGFYDPFEQNYTKLLSLRMGSLASLLAADSQYLVWMESLEDSNWGKTNLHVYDQAAKTDAVIYTHTVNPETGYVYAENWSKPVILDGMLYFDDITGVQENYFQIDLFSCRLQDKTVELVEKTAKRPMIYKNKPAWLCMGDTIHESALYAYDASSGQKEKVLTISDSAGGVNLQTMEDMTAVTQGIYSKYARLLNRYAPNLPDDETDSVDCTFLQMWRDGSSKPVLVTKSVKYIEALQGRRNVVAFNANGIYAKPIFYDSARERLVTLDAAEADKGYTYIISDRYLAYSSYAQSGQTEESTCYILDLMQLQ